MSLVGTRPILPDELEQYELHHRARIAIKSFNYAVFKCCPKECIKQEVNVYNKSLIG